MANAVTWPAVTDVDPHPSAHGDNTDFGSGPTVFGDLPGIIDAAQGNHPAALADRLENGGSAYCVYNDDRTAPQQAEAAESGPASSPVATTPPSAPATKK